MIDGVTLDQLRTFIAAVDEGSFSAAGRKLRRAQSVVSQTLANLEAQLGVRLFDRSARYPQLTDEGRSLLADARSVASNVDEFKARARAMREGLEPELSVAVDVMYPMEALTRAAVHSQKTYPHTPLRLYVEALGGVIKPVLDRNCSIGVVGSLPLVPDELQSESLLSIPFATVVSPSHPLARTRGEASASAIAKHVQLVLSDRTVVIGGPKFRRIVAADLAPCGSRSQARLSQGRLGMGAHAGAHGEGGPRQRRAGQDPGRRLRRAT